LFEVCIDTGGTFTDCVVLDEKNRLVQFKVDTTPHDLSEGLVNSLKEAASYYELTEEQFVGQIKSITHGTTVALNAFLTRTGARTALITTKGFRDIIEIRRGLKNIRTSMYNVLVPPYTPLVPRRFRFTVEERTIYNGEVLTPLNDTHLMDILEKIKQEKIASVAICFIHAFANSENEKKAVEICRQVLGDGVYVCASHEVVPIVGEYARESTTILNAYLGPIVSKYLAALEEKLKRLNFKGQLLMMQADAFVQSVAQAIKKPVYLMISGPASAPAGAVHMGKMLQKPNIIGVDMGGTSFDIDFVRNGEINLSSSKWIEDEMCAIKMVDITTVGAGGGSIAWIDSMGLLRVGPGSAGAEPGPACYGRGGEKAAVTDADLILGYIPDDYFLGGKHKLQTKLARSAVSHIADRLHMSIEQTAGAIFSVVNSNMADAITEVTTRNGYDVRDFSLLACGGAGPIHAAFLADLLGIPEVIVPRFAATFCAWSMFTLDIGRDYLRSLTAPVEKVDLDTINRLFSEMEEEALAEAKMPGVTRKDVEIYKTMEMRYRNQFQNVEVGGLPEGKIGPQDMKQVVCEFHSKHQELYTFSMPLYEVELRALRTIARINKPKIKMKGFPVTKTDPTGALKRKRQCFFNDKYVLTPIYDGDKLEAGNAIEGPAIIEETTTTVVVPALFNCIVDKYGNYLIRRG
jgi:N-methylhydantoinase A